MATANIDSMTSSSRPPARADAEPQANGGRRGDAGSLARWSWALFDWAQQPYYTLVGSYVFRTYFVAYVAASPEIGQIQVGLTSAIAGLAVAILGPLVGVAIERRSAKAWLFYASIPFILSCIGLWWAVPGDPPIMPLILCLLVIGSIGAEITTTINNAMLPGLARKGGLGRLSGMGIAIGALAGILSMALMVAFFLSPDQPLFGLDKASHEPERFTGPLSALWYVIFLIPLFLFVPSKPVSAGPSRPFAELWQLLRALPSNRPMLAFLAGRMLIADALGAINIFGAIIATAVFGWSPTELGIFALLLLACSAVGALLGGLLDDRLSARYSVLISCGLLAIALVGVGSATTDHVLFFLPVDPPVPGDGLFASTGERAFIFFCCIFGIAGGPLQSSVRTWLVDLSPPGEEGRWFGLFAFAGRATAFAAPLMVSIATALTGDLRSSIPVILFFLVLGGIAFAFTPARRRTA
jgi:UMF1 family MFS transporter